MIGDQVFSDGIEFEVIWAGGEGLVPPRETKPGLFWSAPKRVYNKKADFWTNGRLPITSVDKLKITSDTEL